MSVENIQDYQKLSTSVNCNLSANKIIHHLREIRDICRDNKWYASASYASLSAESLFHMINLGDSEQRPDMLITITDIHYSEYPDEYDEEECD